MMTLNNANIIQREIKTTRDALQPVNAKLKGGKCVHCGRDAKFHRIAIHGQNNGVYLCDDCYNGNIPSYHNSQRHGYKSADGLRQTKDKISIGQEFEIVGFSPLMLAQFAFYGFKFETDCTVTMEGISPIYTSMSGLSKIYGLCENYENNPNVNFSMKNSRCGLHTHFGYDNKPISDNIRNHCKELFQPLADYIADLSIEKQRCFFGRALIDTDYVEKNISLHSHYSMFNFQHTYTIEFRLLRFKNANDTAKIVKILRSVMSICFDNDGKLLNSTISKMMVEKLDNELRKF